MAVRRTLSLDAELHRLRRARSQSSTAPLRFKRPNGPLTSRNASTHIAAAGRYWPSTATWTTSVEEIGTRRASSITVQYKNLPSVVVALVAAPCGYIGTNSLDSKYRSMCVNGKQEPCEEGDLLYFTQHANGPTVDARRRPGAIRIARRIPVRKCWSQTRCCGDMWTASRSIHFRNCSSSHRPPNIIICACADRILLPPFSVFAGTPAQSQESTRQNLVKIWSHGLRRATKIPVLAQRLASTSPHSALISSSRAVRG